MARGAERGGCAGCGASPGPREWDDERGERGPSTGGTELSEMIEPSQLQSICGKQTQCWFKGKEEASELLAAPRACAREEPSIEDTAPLVVPSLLASKIRGEVQIIHQHAESTRTRPQRGRRRGCLGRAPAQIRPRLSRSSPRLVASITMEQPGKVAVVLGAQWGDVRPAFHPPPPSRDPPADPPSSVLAAHRKASQPAPT